MRVYTFYQVIDNYSEESQRKLLDVWARSWAKRGWEPIVLSIGDAMLHPQFKQFRRAIRKLPTEYGHQYEEPCFLRWLAMAVQETDGGGGMLTDYDAINYSFEPVAPDPAAMKVYCGFPPNDTVICGAINATRGQYQHFCDLFMNWKPDQHDFVQSSTYRGYHCSDLSLLVRMFEDKTFPKPEWCYKIRGVHEVWHPDREAWKQAPIVHYGYQFIQAGYNPKYLYVEQARAL